MADVKPGNCDERRTQSIVDIVASVVVAMLAWPNPVARAMLTPAVHVAGVLAACVVVQLAYYTVSAMVWRQTLGMRLVGIRLASTGDEPLTRAQVLKWGLISALIAPWFAVAPGPACSAAVAEKASGTQVTSVE